MRPSALIASTLVLATTALAACGGVDKNAYVDSVTKVQAATSSEAAKLSGEMEDAKSVGAVADKLEDLGQAVEKNAGSLADIEAPDDVAGLHEQYVTLMKKFGTDLETLAGRVRKADAKNVNAVLTQASKLTADLATDESKIVGEINDELRG